MYLSMSIFIVCLNEYSSACNFPFMVLGIVQLMRYSIASVIQDIAILELASCYPFEGFVELLITIRKLCNFLRY